MNQTEVKINMKDNNTVGRARLAAFFDADTFVELGAYVKRPGTDHAEGVICGYGALDGRLVFAFAQDSTGMKGALDGRHADKIVATYEKALSVGAPIVGFFDCAGAVVFDGADALAGYGKLLAAASRASGAIPQIAVISGTCAGTMAAVASLCDLTVVVEGKSRLYVNSPSLVGEEVGSAAFAMANGNAAVSVTNEEGAFAAVRGILSYLPDCAEGAAPAADLDDLNRACAIGDRASAAEALAATVDAGVMMPLFAGMAENVNAGLAFIGGVSCVVLGIDGALTLAGVEKMTRLCDFADSFALPVVSFVNCEGIDVDAAAEPRMAAALATLASVMANADNARVTALVGQAIGAGFLFGGARRLGADVVYALPAAEVATMSASSGVAFLWTDRITTEVTREALEAEWRSEVASPVNAAATGEIDDIVDGAELRARVIAALFMLADKE